MSRPCSYIEASNYVDITTKIYGVVWVLHAIMACNFGLGLVVVDTSVAIRNRG